jgi:hypothetical protein
VLQDRKRQHCSEEKTCKEPAMTQEWSPLGKQRIYQPSELNRFMAHVKAEELEEVKRLLESQMPCFDEQPEELSLQ